MLVPRIRMHHTRMARLKRPFMPGAVFHVTTRCQARIHWFDEEIRHEIVRSIRDSIHKCDAVLLAFAVMSNHLHLIVRQMRDPLSALMQPLLTRCARRTQRLSGASNHIFGGRYAVKSCGDARHTRNAIVYTHANPVRAGMCKDALEYIWSSERYYRMPAPLLGYDDLPVAGLHLFSPYPEAPNEVVIENYLRYASVLCPPGAEKPNEEAVGYLELRGGDEIWQRMYAALPSIGSNPVDPKEDLRDIAQRILVRHCPGLELEDLYWIKSPRAVSVARKEIIEAALRAGHSGAKTAKFLRVSEAAVSRCRRAALAERLHA